jgi:hypothetical protein
MPVGAHDDGCPLPSFHGQVWIVRLRPGPPRELDHRACGWQRRPLRLSLAVAVGRLAQLRAIVTCPRDMPPHTAYSTSPPGVRRTATPEKALTSRGDGGWRPRRRRPTDEMQAFTSPKWQLAMGDLLAR